jgi:4-amino-4-deoxy-L-arabinose transferase-like glycosyltransferase
LALVILYPTMRRLLESRLAALLTVLIFATLPTYWRWATQAKIYTLHILLLSGILFLLTRCLEVEKRRDGGAGNRGIREIGDQEIRRSESQGSKQGGGQASRPPTVWRQTGHLVLAGVLFGLALGNHSTTVLLAPGLFLFVWLNCRPSHAPRSTLHAPRFTFYVLRFTYYPSSSCPCFSIYTSPYALSGCWLVRGH